MTTTNRPATTPHTRRDGRDRGPVRAVLGLPSMWLGVALGVAGFLDLGPFDPASPMTWILPLLALSYLVFGAFRGAYRRRGVLRVQVLGLAGFSALAVAALVLDPVVGQYLVAAGWLAHAVWDLAHRDGRVVPRWYVSFCAPLDVLVAASLVVAAWS